MAIKTRIILIVLCVLMLFLLPFFIPSGAMLQSYYGVFENFLPDSGLLPVAFAEETEYALPIDFSAGMTPNPDGFTEEGYQDDSITVKMETLEKDGVIWRIAWVQIADASQLRTGTAGSLTSSRTALVSDMAARYNAVVAISGDYFANDPAKTSFEYRMGEKIRKKRNNAKDLLIIDENGDFHLFVKSDSEKLQAFYDSGRTIVNAFTFGPALVMDGELLQMDTGYGYNPNGEEPRMAIGQTGELNYVFVLAEGRTDQSEGVDHQTLADFMFDIGCLQAFNLDGGNTATLVFNGAFYQTGRTVSNERSQSDIIYFASAVDPSAWGGE